MPLDPSIPLSIQPPRQPDQIGQAMQAYTLKSAMMESQRAEQQMRDSQVLRSVLSSPDAMTPDGSPKPETIQKLMASGNVGPAQQLLQADRQRKTDLMNQQKLKMEMGEKFMNQAGPVYAGLATKLDQGAKWEDLKPEVDQANQQTAQLAQQAGIPFKPLEDPKQLESFSSGWSKYSEHKMKMAEQAGKPQSALGKIDADVKAGLVSPSDAAKAKARMTSPTKTQINIGGGQPVRRDLGAEYEKMDEPAKKATDMQAWNYINKGQLPYRKGTGGGADRNDVVIHRAGEIASTIGMTPEELSSKSADFKANAQSLSFSVKKLDAIQGVLESFHNNVQTWDSIAQGIAPALGGEKAAAMKDQLQKINFVGVKSLDEMKLKIQQQINDPTVAAYLTATMAVSMDYARVMQGPQSTASLTEGARNEAMRLISAGVDNNARKAIIGTLYSDTEGQVKGLEDQTNRIRKRMGMGGAKAETPAQPTAPDKSVPGSTGKKWVFDPASGTLKPQ